MATRPTYWRQQRILWLILGIIILLVILAVILWATLGRSTPTRVTRRDVLLTISSNGQVVAPPAAQAEVYANNNAPVEQVYVSVGQRVRRGDEMVQLYYPSIDEARQQAQLQLQQAQQAYTDAQQTYGQNLVRARKELADAQDAVRAARQAQAAAPIAPTGAIYNTRPEVILIQAAPGQDQEQAQGPPSPPSRPSADLNQALARQQVAQQDYTQAQQDMQTALEPYRQQLQAAQAAVTQAQAGTRSTQLRSPISGTVVTLNAVPGKTLTSPNNGPPLVAQVVDLTQVQVSAPLSEEQASIVQPGMSATLTFTELPNQQFTGTVARISATSVPVVSGEQPQPVALVTFDNRAGRVRPGMHPHAAIMAGRATDVLAVPNSAVTTDGQGRTVVYVRQGGEWQPVVVEIGLRGNAYTEIRSGLQEGQIVRTSPV